MPSDLPGLKIFVDGLEVPAVAHGLPRMVNPGNVIVRAEADFGRRAGTKIEVPPGARVTVDLDLQRGGEPLPDPDPAPPPAGPTDPYVPQYVLMGVGSGVFAAGLAVGIVGIVEASDAADPDAKDAAETKTIAGDVVGAVGLATLAAGLIWYLVDDGEPDGDAPAQTGRLRPFARGPVAGFELRF